MWAHEQIFVSGNIFRLWNKYTLHCFKNPDKLPNHSSTHKTSLHPFWHHFIDPFDHHNYFKFLSRGDVCEASTSLALPNGMRLFEHLHMTKSSSLAQFERKLALRVSAPSWSRFWPILVSYEATAVNLGPFLLKHPRTVVLPSLNTPDITLDA